MDTKPIYTTTEQYERLLSQNSRWRLYSLPLTISEEIVVVGTTTTYIGVAANGTTLTSTATWSITKIIEVVAGGTTTTTIYLADGDFNFDNIWDNRASLTYSLRTY